MKKKEIFVNKIKEKVGNNQDSCEVNEIKDENTRSDNLSVDEKLDKLFNTNGYIFNIKVKIITDNKTYDTKIASKIGNSIITLDNDVICIDTIKDIIY